MSVIGARIPELKRGPKWLREYLNMLRKCVQEWQPIGGVTGEFPNGRMVGGGDNGGGGETLEEPLVPFDCIAAGEGRVRVVYGTINSIQPLGMFPGDVPEFILENVHDGDFIYAAVSLAFSANWNSWTPTNVQILKGGIVPDGTPARAYWQLGSVSINAGEMTVQSNKSGVRNLWRCGNTQAFTDIFL